jgi:hypothetical protein
MADSNKPPVLSAEIRDQIEPNVRHVLDMLAAVRAEPAAMDINLRGPLHQLEYALGQMLPTIKGRLNVPIDSVLMGKTLTLNH